MLIKSKSYKLETPHIEPYIQWLLILYCNHKATTTIHLYR